MDETVESKIVEAVGAASSTLNPAFRGLSRLIEASMSQAINDCYAAGITDPSAMRAAMLAARDKTKADFYAKLAAD